MAATTTACVAPLADSGWFCSAFGVPVARTCVAQAPRLGSFGLACVLRGELDGAVHEDKDVCKVASMEAMFLGC